MGSAAQIIGPRGLSGLPGFGLGYACSDENTPIATTGIKLTAHIPQSMNINKIYFSLNTIEGSVSTPGKLDILINGSSIINNTNGIEIFDNLYNSISAFANESDNINISQNDKLEIDITTIDPLSVATGLKVYLIGGEFVEPA